MFVEITVDLHNISHIVTPTCLPAAGCWGVPAAGLFLDLRFLDQPWLYQGKDEGEGSSIERHKNSVAWDF